MKITLEVDGGIENIGEYIDAININEELIKSIKFEV